MLLRLQQNVARAPSNAMKGQVLDCVIPSQNFSTFIKRLGVYSYKLKKSTFKLYSNPHLVPLKVREALSKVSFFSPRAFHSPHRNTSWEILNCEKLHGGHNGRLVSLRAKVASICGLRKFLYTISQI